MFPSVVYVFRFAHERTEFTVQLDTGSSDLWIYAPGNSIKVLNDSHLSANLTYGTGSVDGPIQFAEVKIGEYTIPSQGEFCLALLFHRHDV